MSGFLFAFLATVFAGIGARDQLTLAGLATRHGQRPALLLLALLTSMTTAGLAAWAALAVLPLLAGKLAAGKVLTAMALGMAGGEMLLFGPRKVPDEPTQSLGATAIVLLAHQLTDAARFVVFALAVVTSAPIAAGLGGAVGSAGIVTLGWLAAGDLPLRQVILARRMAGILLLLVASWLALSGLGRI